MEKKSVAKTKGLLTDSYLREVSKVSIIAIGAVRASLFLVFAIYAFINKQILGGIFSILMMAAAIAFIVLGSIDLKKGKQRMWMSFLLVAFVSAIGGATYLLRNPEKEKSREEIAILEDDEYIIAVGGFFKDLWKRIKFTAKTIFHNKKAFAGTIILSIFIFIAIFGRRIFPFDGTTSFEKIYLSPSPEYFLGTDGQGRDLFRMIIHGTRDVLSIAFYAAIITVGIGTVVGVFSGYIGGWVDRVVGLIINIFMSIPTFPLLLIIAHFVTVKGNLALAFLLSIFAWPGLARAVRSQIISLKERDFIQICEVMGLSRGHIIFKELMPNVFSYVAINFINSMRSAITASIGLMTIGAVTYEITNWGGIIITARANGAMSIPEARLCIIAPIVAIMVFQIGAILFSNGLDELVNPRLREK